MSVRRWQFHISHISPLPESWLTDKAPVKPSLKFNEPYIIWDRLRLTLSHSELVLCFSQVKQCRCKGREGADINLYSPVGRVKFFFTQSDRVRSFGATSLQGWVDAERNAGFTCISPANRGLVTSVSQLWHRLNVIHPPLLKWDFSQFHVTESFCWNSEVSRFLAYTSILKPNPFLFNTNTGDYTVDVQVRDQLKLLPGSRVILCPHADEFIKVMRP